MSDDNVDRETLPFRLRDSDRDPVPISESRHSPDIGPGVDFLKKSAVPVLSDGESPAGSSTTNRAHHSASASLSNKRPGSVGAVPNNFLSDDLSEQGIEFIHTTAPKGHQPVWSEEQNASTCSLNRPVSLFATENRAGNSGIVSNGKHSSRFSPDSTDDRGSNEAGPSRPYHRNIRSSPTSNGSPNADSSARKEGTSLPSRRSRVSSERLSYGQESAQGLSNEQKSAGELSAVAGEEQLINEVRGIYAGLLMVEKKCIQIDKQQSESKTDLSHQQWQALIALHRTLLQEHHDFFMASQHPSASHALRRISEKYAMPARMWRYGIHAFLELLRHRLPDSLEPMLTFIYFAYSMMTLLLETVPAFEETWIECLGDLSRYRMAVEESNLQDREVWGGVAKYWYNRAADRNPDVGRIQHHLAVLARPDILQQLFYYTKSLVSVRAFPGTRESILLLFNPLMKGPRVIHHHQIIADFVTAHGYLFGRDCSDRFVRSADNFLSGLDNYVGRVGAAFKIQGVYITSSNLAAMLEYASPDALLPTEFHQEPIPDSRSPEDVYQQASSHWASVNDPQKVASDFLALNDSQKSSRLVYYGSCLTFHALSVFLDQIGDKNIFPALHLSLAFLWCLSSTQTGMRCAELVVPWKKIVTFLNTMFLPLLDMSLVEGDGFPLSDETKWLPEDFFIRGQVWSQAYYPQSFFEGSPTEDNGRNIELPSLKISRMYRCLWLGVRLAKFNRWMIYDSALQKFSVTAFALELEKLAEPYSPFLSTTEQQAPSADVEMRGS